MQSTGTPESVPAIRFPLMTDSSGVWEVWNLGVGDDGRVLEHIPELTESATEDE